MKRIIVITHSTSNTGAPKICLSVIKFFRKYYPNSKIDVLSLDSGGSLEQEFIDLSSNYISINTLSRERDYSLWNRIKLKLFKNEIISDYESKIKYFQSLDYEVIFANTIVSLSLALLIKFNRSSSKLILNLLEMNTVIDQLCSNFTSKIKGVDKVIFISNFHKTHIEETYNLKLKDSCSIIPPISLISFHSTKKKNDKIFRVVMAGSVHWRKGDDIFIQIARKTIEMRKDVKFYWYGPIDNYHKKIIDNDIKKLGIEDYVFFMGEKDDPHAEIINMDIFLLTSREEPFGLAPAEAGLLGLPIIYFKEVTGIGALLEENNLDFGVKYLNIDEMTLKLHYLLENPCVYIDLSTRTKTLMTKYNEHFYWENLNNHLILSNEFN